jgi:hypothetical protein
VDFFRLEQRLLDVKKVEEGGFVSARTKLLAVRKVEKGGFVLARTKTSCCKEGRRRSRMRICLG